MENVNEVNNNTAKNNKDLTDPMSFMTDEEAAVSDKKMEKFLEALRFGCHELCDLLQSTYERNGLEGLRSIYYDINTLYIVRCAVGGGCEIAIDYNDNGDEIMTIINKNDEIESSDQYEESDWKE